MAGRTRNPLPTGPRGKRLQDRRDAQCEQRQAEQVHRRRRRQSGHLDDEQRIDQLDADQADMLHAHEQRDERRRDVVGPVDEVLGSLSSRGERLAAQESQPCAHAQCIRHGPGEREGPGASVMPSLPQLADTLGLLGQIETVQEGTDLEQALGLADHSAERELALLYRSWPGWQ